MSFENQPNCPTIEDQLNKLQGMHMFKCPMAIKNDSVEEHLMTRKMFTESFICSTTSCQGPCFLLSTKWICIEGIC